MNKKPLIATSSLLAALALAIPVAAQDAPAAQTCSPSDIDGEWLMMTNNDYAPSICLLKIKNNGEVKKGECTTGREEAKLTGVIAVDKKCGISGKFKIKTGDETLARDIGVGIMSPDKSFFSLVAFEKDGKELNTSIVQRVPQ